MKKAGFTLIEMLVVVAIIGIMSALVVAAISNAASDSRVVVARQQQTILQEALTAWITAQSSGKSASLYTAQQAYNGATDSLARLNLISPYLDPITYGHFIDNTTEAGKIKSDALAKAGLYLQFSAWEANSHPRVNMIQEQ